MPLHAGSRLGPYEIVTSIGAGAMGEVYRVRDTSLQRDVAIKLLPSECARDPDRLRRFGLEARAAAALNHPNILSVFHVGQHDGVPYIVTELLEGETLRDRLRRGPLRLREAISTAIAIAQGLAAAHEKGIAHRDLKPENLFLTRDGRTKVLDFGLAKLLQEPPSASESPTLAAPDRSDPGHVVGTVGYMSPEQVRGQTADGRSDIFALGCVLYEMLSGKRAFQKPTAAETMSAILNEELPDLSGSTPSLPRSVHLVVHRCLEKAPERRFQSASDLAFALEALSESSSSAAGAIPVARPRRLLPWVVAAVVILTPVAAWYVHRLATGSRRDASPPRLQVRTLTQTGAAYRAAVAPDGRYVAYVSKQNGQYELRLLQVATERDVPLLPGAPLLIRSLHFSPDGNYIYFLRQVRREDSEGLGVFRIATLGGPPTLVASDARPHSVTVSPDGKQVAYIGRAPGESLIVAVDFDGSNRHVLARRPAGSYFWFVEWSPRLDTLAAVVDREEGMGLVRIELPSGAVHPLAGEGWGSLGQPAWSPDGSIIYTASVNEADIARQVWAFDAHTGAPRQLTSSPNAYGQWGLSASASGDLVGTTDVPNCTLWVTNPSGHLAAIPSSKDAGTFGVAWVNDRIVTSNARALTVSEPDGRNAGTVRVPSTKPARCGPTHVVYGAVDAARKSHIARVDILAGTTTPLTEGPYDSDPTCTPDGSTLVFNRCVPQEGRCYLESRSLASRRSLRLFTAEMGGDWFHPSDPTVSWDGSKVLFRSQGKDPYAWAAIVPISGGPVEPLRMAFSDGDVDSYRWAPGDRSILCVRRDEKGVENLWSMPLDGKPPRRVTSFEADFLYAFDVSADNRLVLSHGSGLRDVVLIHP